MSLGGPLPNSVVLRNGSDAAPLCLSLQVTSYGGELRYTITHDTFPGSPALRGQPDVLLQGNEIFLEHVAETSPLPGSPTTFTVPFREVRHIALRAPWSAGGRAALEGARPLVHLAQYCLH